MAAGLRPNPLGKLKRSPDPLATIWGLLLRGGKERGGEGREGKGSGAPHMTFTHDAPGDVLLCVEYVHKLEIRSECA